mgnify:FL=1
MGISDEFKKFGAKQKNIQWSVSAFNDKDELVVSIWGHQPLLVFNKESRIQIYKDKVSRWSGLGNQEFRKNIEIAYLKNLKVRPIITLSKNFEEILKGADGSQFKKTFNAKLNWVGIVKLWDGENFIIEFVEEKT